MNTTELVAWVREEATLSTKSKEYDATRIVELMNKQLDQAFTPLIAGARSGNWLHTFTRTLGLENPYVRLPPRACPAIEQVDISLDGVNWEPLTEALESESQDWAREAQMYNWPQAYTLRGTHLYLLNAAKIPNVQVRVKVILRPSVLYTEQTNVGYVTAVDLNTRQITLTSMPVDRSTGLTLAGSPIIDIIEPRGCFELSLCDAKCTVLNPTTVQIDAGHSLARVAVGDVLRAADQTDWPQLPKEFHSVLGTAAAVPVCRQREMTSRADNLASSANAGMQRLAQHLLPRVRVDVHRPTQHHWQ